MEAAEILHLIAGGESSKLQFKENVTNVQSIAQEIAAFANTKGGRILIGINDKTGEPTGLEYADIQRINSLLTTAANEHIKTPVFIETETLEILAGKRLLIVSVPEGSNKPHTDKDGLIFLKNGSDKRKITGAEGIARLLQSSGKLEAEEIPVRYADYTHIDRELFNDFYRKRYEEEADPEQTERYMRNLRLGKDGILNVAGVLLFGKDFFNNLLPEFGVSAVWFPGTDKAAETYRSNENIGGTLVNQYEKAYAFIKKCIHFIPEDAGSFNSQTKAEIPLIVFQELLINALLHRDYFIKDKIKVFIFTDRIEIISPGKLPNSLTIDQMKSGLRKTRNSVLQSFALDLLPFKGIGSGVLRALKAYKNIEFINDRTAEQFSAIIKRPKV